MKRIVEDFTSIEIQVGELFEAGTRKEKGSDSSRNTFGTRHTQRSAAWSFTPRFTQFSWSSFLKSFIRLKFFLTAMPTANL